MRPKPVTSPVEKRRVSFAMGIQAEMSATSKNSRQVRLRDDKSQFCG
nr:MAG TPA: hypothetical protein [Caudoviricetes sp.]